MMQPGFRGAPLPAQLWPPPFLGAPGPRTHSSHVLFLKKVGASFGEADPRGLLLLCALMTPPGREVPSPGLSVRGGGWTPAAAIPACWEVGHLTWMRGPCAPRWPRPNRCCWSPRAPPGHQEGQGRERKQGPGLMLTQPGTRVRPVTDFEPQCPVW